MQSYNRDPFGIGAMDPAPGGEPMPPGADPGAIPPDQIGRTVETLDEQRPGMARSWDEARRVYGGWPGLPPALRFPSNSLPVWPTRAIVPDPKLFPNVTARTRGLVIEAPPAPGSTTFQAQIQFSDYLTIYAISGGAKVKDSQSDLFFFGVTGMEHIRLQMTRDTGDQLTTGGLLFMNSIVGTAENPFPIGTPGWAFAQNQSLVVSGQLETPEDWIITLAFHCIESVPATNLGMSRTPQYTSDGR